MFTILAILIARYDLILYNESGKSMEDFRVWYISVMHLPKTLNFLVSTAGACLYLRLAIQFNRIRVKLANKYLANIILSSIIYQAASRLFEMYYSMSESDFYYIIYVVTKFYIPLDILSVVFLSVVAINGFLIPANSDSKKFGQINQLMLLLCIWGTLVGVGITLWALMAENSIWKIVIIIAGALLALILTIFTFIAIFNILKTWRKMPPFRAMAIQLFLALCAILLLVLAEIGGTFNITMQVIYLIKMSKNMVFILIGLLYYPAIIKPSKDAAF